MICSGWCRCGVSAVGNSPLLEQLPCLLAEATIGISLGQGRHFAFQNPVKKYVNIPSEKYIYVHIYVCICVNTYLCKMDERRSYASLS